MGHSHLPPGPQMSTGLLKLHWLFRRLQLLDSCARRYGDAFTLARDKSGHAMVVVSKPQHLQRLFSAPPEGLLSRPINHSLRHLIGNRSMFLLDGEAHKRARRLSLPPFQMGRMASYGQELIHITERWMERLPRARPFSFSKAAHSLVLEVVLRLGVGLKSQAELDLMGSCVTQLYDGLAPGLNPVRLWSTLRRLRDMKSDSDLRLVDTAVLDIIRRRRGEHLAGRTDFLSQLLQARSGEDGFDDAEIRDHLITMFFAGIDTMTSALTWSLRWILAAPATLDRLRQEIASCVEASRLMPEKVDALPYLDAAVREALRLVAVIPSLARVATSSLDFDDFVVPAGTMVVGAIYLAHRRAESFPEPLRFRPERFLGAKPSQYQWLPFGGGARRCIGLHFGLYGLRLALATLLWGANFALRSRRLKPVMVGVATGPSGGLIVSARSLRPRNQVPS